MRDFTTEEVIKIIPMDEAKRKELLQKYASATDDEKYVLGRAAWNVFHTFREQVTNLIYSEFMQQIIDGKRTKTPTIMDEVEQEVEHEFEELIAGKHEEMSEISDIRSRLEAFIKKPSN